MSREIDALVAEHVMGLPVTSEGKIRGYHLGLGEGEPKRYSTNIADAWEVVEWMKMYEPNITWSDSDHMWICHFDKYVDFVISNESAPMAICLAALKAKGIDTNGL